MVNMTISVSEDLHKKIRSFPEVKWSEVARRAIEERVSDLEDLNRLASKSRLTQRDADEISRKIKAAAARKFLG